MLIPDHETAVDLLNYQAISTTITKLIQNNTDKPITIGVHGSWGAGKSSILKMIEEDLSKGKDTLCLWFNGWTFQGFDDAKIVLIETIVDELRRKRSNFDKVTELSSNLMKRIDWLKATKKLSGYAITAATGIPSLDMLSDLSGLMDKALSAIKSTKSEGVEQTITDALGLLKLSPPTSVPEVMHYFRKEFQELLEKAQIKQLVILIDDLDRCLPETAIETLEAIRLFLFVPKSAFIIAADEAMIEYSVKQHFPDLPYSHESTSYARNYLEKLIQVPFRIPSMGAQETKAYVTLLLMQNIVGEEHKEFLRLLGTAKNRLTKPWEEKPLSLSEVESVSEDHKIELTKAYVIGEQIGGKLTEGTSGNPRQIKRFINSMLLRTEIARALGYGDSIDFQVLAKLMLAEMLHKDFYGELSRIVLNSSTGKAEDLKWLEDTIETPEDPEEGNDKKSKKVKIPQLSEYLEKWRKQEYLKTWAGILPKLSDTDLRPYIFVSRDKRLVISDGVGLDKLAELKVSLSNGQISAAGKEQEIKNLSPEDAERLFNDLREIVLKGDMQSEPKCFEGLRLIVKYHHKHQSDLLQCVILKKSKDLGPWVVRGWDRILTEENTKQALGTFLVERSKDDTNPLLKQAAQNVLTSQRKV